MDLQHSSLPGLVRNIGGTQTSLTTVESPTARFEVFGRRAHGWTNSVFRAPVPALLWLRDGCRRLRVGLDGAVTTVDQLAGPSLIFIPANVTLTGEYYGVGEASYTTSFILPSRLTAEAPMTVLDEPIVNFRHRQLEQSVADMSREAARPDNLFDMLAESWTLQALVYLRRKGHNDRMAPRHNIGGLSRVNRTRVEEYIQAHLTESITLSDLAQVTGLTTRHLSRAFHVTFATTPMQFILSLRILMAKRMLIETRVPVTEVALACGFSHAQHFATSFGKAVGTSPSVFRHHTS